MREDSNSQQPSVGGGSRSGQAPDLAASRAADAAIRLVEQESAKGETAGSLRRTRFWGLTLATISVLGFVLCVATGGLLALWANEDVISHESTPTTVFTEQNFPLVIGSHVGAGILLIVSLAGYVWLHLSFRQRIERSPTEEVRRQRTGVRSGWFAAVGVVPVIGFALAAHLLGTWLPDKPSAQQRAEAWRTMTVDELQAEGERSVASAFPLYIDSPREEELWIWHTLVLPLLVTSAYLWTLLAVYSLQTTPLTADEARRFRKRWTAPAEKGVADRSTTSEQSSR